MTFHLSLLDHDFRNLALERENHGPQVVDLSRLLKQFAYFHCLATDPVQHEHTQSENIQGSFTI